MAFKMKGHTLPGIKQKSEGNTDLKDGRSGSAAFQQKSALKQALTKEEYMSLYPAASEDEKEKVVQLGLTKDEITKGLLNMSITEIENYRSKNAPKYKSAFQHRVDDVPSHQDEYGEEHYEDLQTDEEHKNGTRTHWPDGTKRTKREIFEWDETKAEEEKEKDKKRPQGVDSKWENADEVD